jgi:hypothetical protein
MTYNLSLYEGAHSLMDMYAVTDTLMSGMFSMFLVMVFGVFVFYMRSGRDPDILNSLLFASFFSLMLSITLYVSNTMYSGLTKGGLYLYIPALILVIVSAIKYFKNR